MSQTCLIAAHDPWFIQLLRIYSEESGLQVIQASEGQDVLLMISREKPAAILIQADLPGEIQGMELVNRLRQDPDMKNIPVLLFSWVNMNSVDGLPDGAALYIQEPITYETFHDALLKAGILHAGQENASA